MRFTRLRILCFLLGIVYMSPPQHVWSASVTENGSLGSFSAAWLDLPGSARDAALGGSFSAVTDDVDALVGNPAGLGQWQGREISITHCSWLKDTRVEQGRYCWGLGPGRMAVGFSYVDFGKTDRIVVVDDQPVEAGTLYSYAWCGALGYGVPLGKGFSFGLGGKFLRETLDSQSANGGTGDAGMIWKPRYTDWRFGLSLVNVGSLGGARTPWETRLGVAYDWNPGREPMNKGRDRFMVAVEVARRFQEMSDGRGSVGAEYWIRGDVAVRVGQQWSDTTGLKGLRGFSSGVGLNLKPGRLDYAFTTWGDMGHVNTITFVATR
jgi:hypothetical protein